MKARCVFAFLLILSVISASLILCGRFNPSDWRSVSGGGAVCVYKVTYEKNAHVTYGESPLHALVTALPRPIRRPLHALAGPDPAEWWANAGNPMFIVWLVSRGSSNRAPADLQKLLLVLPDGREISGMPTGWLVGTKDALRSYRFDDPALRALPRLHLRAFVKEQLEPLEFDIVNSVRDAVEASAKAASNEMR